VDSVLVKNQQDTTDEVFEVKSGKEVTVFDNLQYASMLERTVKEGGDAILPLSLLCETKVGVRYGWGRNMGAGIKRKFPASSP
jgi:hypothetical protein